MSINGSAANLAADSTLPLFAAQKLLRILTEHFFLYRFVVFCPDNKRLRQKVKKSRNSKLRGQRKGGISWGEAGTASEALLGFFRYQPKHSKSLWSVERMTHRGLPDNFNPVRRRPLTTKQIDSKPVSNCRSVAL